MLNSFFDLISDNETPPENILERQTWMEERNSPHRVTTECVYLWSKKRNFHSRLCLEVNSSFGSSTVHISYNHKNKHENLTRSILYVRWQKAQLCTHPDNTLMNWGLAKRTVATKHTWSSKAGCSDRCNTPARPFLVMFGTATEKTLYSPIKWKKNINISLLFSHFVNFCVIN